MTDETKGDWMTLDLALAYISSACAGPMSSKAFKVLEAHLAAQSAMRVDEAIPSYWCAIGTHDDDDAGEIVIAYSTDDGNNGEAARTECNQYINDALLNDGVKLHLVPLYTRAALQAAIGGKE